MKEMRRHLNTYVKTEIFKGASLPPKTNRRFYPKKVDIRNHIYRSRVKQAYSKIDQENLQERVNAWRKTSPTDKFYFRPRAERATVAEETTETETMSVEEQESPDGTDEEDVKLETESIESSLLFVHQTEWQRRLLALYGNDLSMLDATYRTTRYSLPLFFLAVKTNVDYQIVGSFVTQSERTDAIKEAIGILKEWNPNWKPNFFMTDFSEEEIQAIEETYPGIWNETIKQTDRVEWMSNNHSVWCDWERREINRATQRD